ncbi:MAG: hypothetical protein AB1758_08530 [Candidatus Eremiobacterota bacterium]
MVITRQPATLRGFAPLVGRASNPGEFQPAPEQDRAVISRENPITPMFNAVVIGGLGIIGMLAGAVAGQFTFSAPLVGAGIGTGLGVALGYALTRLT